MHHLASNLLADISSLPWVALVSIGGGMLIALVVIVGGLIIAHRRQAMWHETARLALEKGQPLPRPPEDETPALPGERRVRESRNDIRSGLILIAVGAGLYIFLSGFITRGLGLVGAIPGFIGVALLLSGVVTAASKEPKNLPPSDRT